MLITKGVMDMGTLCTIFAAETFPPYSTVPDSMAIHFPKARAESFYTHTRCTGVHSGKSKCSAQAGVKNVADQVESTQLSVLPMAGTQ